MEERTLSGYCRALDRSRLVIAELWQEQWTADCAWPDCSHAAACPIAQKLDALVKEQI